MHLVYFIAAVAYFRITATEPWPFLILLVFFIAFGPAIQLLAEYTFGPYRRFSLGEVL